MKRIDNPTLTELADLAAEVKAIVSEYDAERQIAEAKFAEIVTAANEKRQRVYELLEDAHREAEEYFDNRSERWQEGENGVAYRDWVSELERIRDEAGEDIETPEIPDLEEPGWLGEIADPSWVAPE